MLVVRLGCSLKLEQKPRVETARKRRKPVRCWFSGKKVLSCEQESEKEKLEPDALSTFHFSLLKNQWVPSHERLNSRIGSSYFLGGIIPPIPGILPVIVDVPAKQRIDEVESLVFNST